MILDFQKYCNNTVAVGEYSVSLSSEFVCQNYGNIYFRSAPIETLPLIATIDDHFEKNLSSSNIKVLGIAVDTLAHME